MVPTSPAQQVIGSILYLGYMSNEYPNISESDAALASAYSVPLDIMSPAIADMLKTIDQFVREDIPEIPQKVEEFRAESVNIFDKHLSEENITKLREQENPEDIPDSKDFVDKTLLRDAKILFKKHVMSVLEETKDDLVNGPVLAKLGTTLSLPGRALSGISNFWEEMIEDRPFLRILDTVIVKPLELALLVRFLPEVAIIKASELVGRVCCAYAKATKGQKWSAIKSAASKML